MKIYNLDKIIYLPLVLIAALILYLGESTGNRDMTIWIFVPVVFMVITYLFSPQINFWWHKKYPIPLDPKVRQWLQGYSPFYQSLSSDDQEKYDTRLNLYIEGREFKSVGREVRDVPEDVKGMIGSIPIMMGLHEDDFLIGDWDRVYLYKHPFPSPAYQYLHTVEVNHEDLVIIFSLEHLLPGLVRPQECYNIAIQAFAEAYIDTKKISLSDFSNYGWKEVSEVTGWKESFITEYTGHPHLDMRAVWVTIYHTFPVALSQKYPDIYNDISAHFPNIPSL